MSVYTWIIIGLTAGWPVMFCSGLGIGHYIGRDDGYEECRADAAEKKLTERRAAAPRHARPACRYQSGRAAGTRGNGPGGMGADPSWSRRGAVRACRGARADRRSVSFSSTWSASRSA